MGVTDAVPETIEASLQLSEAVLVDLGIPMGFVIASIHEKRDEYRKLLVQSGASDRPRVFTIALLQAAPNAQPTIHRSKAVGEPPLMLATSVLHALSDAVASVADYRACPRLDPPATPEKVLDALSRLKSLAG